MVKEKTMLKDELLSAAVAQFRAQMTTARANLGVYLQNPTAVGEHPDLVAEVVDLTRKIAEAEECLAILGEWNSKLR